jgi:hypothetical protein
MAQAQSCTAGHGVCTAQPVPVVCLLAQHQPCGCAAADRLAAGAGSWGCWPQQSSACHFCASAPRLLPFSPLSPLNWMHGREQSAFFRQGQAASRHSSRPGTPGLLAFFKRSKPARPSQTTRPLVVWGCCLRLSRGNWAPGASARLAQVVTQLQLLFLIALFWLLMKSEIIEKCSLWYVLCGLLSNLFNTASRERCEVNVMCY